MSGLTPQPVNINKFPEKCAKEGPMGISVRPDFSSASSFNFSSDALPGVTKISQIRSMYFDTIDCPSKIIVTVQGSSERFLIPAGSSGYIPINCSVPAQVTMQTQSGAADGGPSTFTFYNYEIQPTFFFSLNKLEANIHGNDGMADVGAFDSPGNSFGFSETIATSKNDPNHFASTFVKAGPDPVSETALALIQAQSANNDTPGGPLRLLRLVFNVQDSFSTGRGTTLQMDTGPGAAFPSPNPDGYLLLNLASTTAGVIGNVKIPFWLG